MHPNDEELGLVLFGVGGVVESFGNVGEVLVSEFEADHFGRSW